MQKEEQKEIDWGGIALSLFLGVPYWMGEFVGKIFGASWTVSFVLGLIFMIAVGLIIVWAKRHFLQS